MTWNTAQEVWWEGHGSCGSCRKRNRTLGKQASDQSKRVSPAKKISQSTKKREVEPMFVTGKVTD